VPQTPGFASSVEGHLSWTASAHVKSLTHHKDGTPLSAREKLILFVLADSHNPDYNCAWPGLTKASAESLTSRRRFIQLIKRLEQKGTIIVERREGKSNLYRFPGLVQSSHPPAKELHTTSATAIAPGSATAITPKPLGSLEVADIQPLPVGKRPVDFVDQAIKESKKTGESADDILKRLLA
jgi:hypothetical protein